jgi:hypothetical protein
MITKILLFCQRMNNTPFRKKKKPSHGRCSYTFRRQIKKRSRKILLKVRSDKMCNAASYHSPPHLCFLIQRYNLASVCYLSVLIKKNNLSVLEDKF